MLLLRHRKYSILCPIAKLINTVIANTFLSKQSHMQCTGLINKI